MEKRNSVVLAVLWTLSCLLVAVLASVATFALCMDTDGPGKLEELASVIEKNFIGEEDMTAMEDAAAAAMVAALPDRWSYYVPLSEMEDYEEQKTNSYVGIGVTITVREDEKGFDITKVEPGGSAHEAGIRPGDMLIEANGQELGPLGTEGARDVIRGPVGKQVDVAVLRDGERLEFSLTLKQIQVAVATGQMLDGNIGYVIIANFNSNCAEQTIGCVEDLLADGAQYLIFDVRNNPGGYKEELVEILDYLLPEGDLFTSEYTSGYTHTDPSDENCVQLPMAVLMNGDSYSAAEFFAAALNEYDWAVTVGQPTIGKGYFQQTISLSDGSAVNLSVGKYYTPNGVCLADVGGLIPEVPVEVDEDTAALIYSQLLEPLEDPQVQAAMEAVKQ